MVLCVKIGLHSKIIVSIKIYLYYFKLNVVRNGK